MVVYCFVKGCTSTHYKKKCKGNSEPASFHGFPSDPNLRAQWIKALIENNPQLNADTLPKYPKICNRHFKAEDIEKNGFMHFRLKPNSVPSIFPNARKSDEINEPYQPTENLGTAQGNNTLLTEAVENVQSASLLIPDLMDFEEAAKQHEILDDPQEAQQFPINKLVTTPKKTIRYPGDVLYDRLDDMTPKTLVNTIRILKRVCEEKTKKIKRLHTQLFRHKKKIENISAILAELRQKCFTSPDPNDILQVLEKFHFTKRVIVCCKCP